jgi:hypothetical protein
MTITENADDKIQRRPPLSVHDFAWRVAGPRDFVINLIVNATVPFWVFRGLDTVPLTGWHSVASVVLPMSFLLCTLTTFFGWFNAIKERRLGTVVPAVAEGILWSGRAWRDGFSVGFPSLGITMLLTYLVHRWMPNATIGFWAAVWGVGLSAAVAGFLLHSRAVVRGGFFGVAPKDIPST